MTIANLEQYRDEVNRLAAFIAAPANLLPTYGRSDDGARPHIEFDGERFHFVVVERGRELERISSIDPDDILYQVFQTVTFSMACSRELRQRRPAEDFRRQLFAIQLDLLGRLSPRWEALRHDQIDVVLQRSPFNDSTF